MERGENVGGQGGGGMEACQPEDINVARGGVHQVDQEVAAGVGHAGALDLVATHHLDSGKADRELRLDPGESIGIDPPVHENEATADVVVGQGGDAGPGEQGEPQQGPPHGCGSATGTPIHSYAPAWCRPSGGVMPLLHRTPCWVCRTVPSGSRKNASSLTGNAPALRAGSGTI